MNPEVYTGPPAESRDPNEMAVYAFLDQLGIAYLRCDHDYANTMEDCKAVEEPFKTKDLTKQLGCARLSFATPEQMKQLLGAAPGSASAFELMHDKEGRVRLVIDRELLAGEWLSGHPCFSTSTIRLKLTDFLERFLPAVDHTPTVVDLPWPEAENL